MVITLDQTVALRFDQFKPDVAQVIEDTWCVIDTKLFEIKKGFWFNGMSGGKLAWLAVDHPFSPRIIVQVMWHDIFYGTHYFTQQKADEILKEMNIQRNKDWAEARKKNPQMPKISLSWWERNSMALGLKIGGSFAYNAQTDEEIIGCSKHLYVNNVQFNPGLIQNPA